MTPSEFKSWFEGFTEAMTGTPTKEQWKRIKARVGEIDGRPITEKVFVDRYWPYYYRYGIWNGPPPAQSVFYSSVSNNTGNLTGAAQGFNSMAATYAMGKADAQMLLENKNGR